MVKAQEDADQRPQAFTPQQLEFFEAKVRPILVEHCFECHGPEASPIEGSLSLASRKAIVAGGDTGPAIVPGHPDDSLLIKSIQYNDVYEMPPDTKLSDEKIKILSDWVKQGAPWPADQDQDTAVKSEFDLDQRKREHWAWKPVRQVKPPQVADAAWPADPIDQFVLHRLEQNEILPAQPAAREVLVRRAYFDVIGLPPTPEQVRAFVEDKSSDAFAKVVDQLLASDHFGERWARHWMDLVRYAETYGHEFDYPIPYPHQYRDYLIRAFNEDVSYKQLIQEHIAGDLIPNPRRHPSLAFNESKLGTGFWFFGEAKHGAVDSRGEEAAAIDNQIDVMSKTFLGLTVACARCHDHKFDAISTEDYYALAGFLQSSRRERMMLDPGRRIESAFTQVDRKASQSQSRIEELAESLQQSDRARLDQYLSAATQLAPAFLPSSNSVMIEGEKLGKGVAPSGTIEVQTIPARDGFAWQGDRQIWWRDGKVGEEWVLEFEVPANASTQAMQQFQVMLGLTKARDYGAARIWLDDQQLQERVDCFAGRLSVAKIELGQSKLAPGSRHKLRFQLLEPHPQAIKRNMIGLDFLALQPIVDQKQQPEDTLTELAGARQLDRALLRRLVDQIVSEQAKQPHHPFFLLRLAADSAAEDGALNRELVTQANSRLKRAKAAMQRFLDNSEALTAFDSSNEEGWSATGFAFTNGHADQPRLSAAEGLLQASGTVSSGSRGKPFQGVLRSPTFELKHNRIHYRLKGHNVTVRLIVNGFFMDEYNGLLFNDCKKNLAAASQFTWQTQAGDLRNHLGNRAHLEIFDQGGGYIELDEIRFSNDGSTPPLANWLEFGEQVAQATNVKDWVGLTSSAMENCIGQLSPNRPEKAATEGSSSTHSVELFNWMAEHDLLGLVGGLSQVNLAPGQPAGANPGNTAKDLIESRGQLRELAAKVPAPMMALGMTDGPGEDEHVFVRGNHKNLGPIVTRRFLSAISKSAIAPAESSGRLQLVRKMTAPNNPLTSRVAVNRIWHHLLGRGIVESVDNFGVLGKQPTHPELLDYLAMQFQRDGWSIKKLIRKIMLSRTYQMSSVDHAETVKRVEQSDPENLLLHRANIKRLQGEAIRDAMLAISGRLDRKMFGASVPIHLTPFMGGRGRPGRSGPLDGDGRRSVYIEVRRNFLSPMMLAFDTPIPFNTIGRRNQSNVPAQALILMNSPLVQDLAQRWAQEVVQQPADINQRIETIYRQALSRSPSSEEANLAAEFLSQQAGLAGLKDDQIADNVELWKDFCHVMFNVKEFIYLQ